MELAEKIEEANREAVRRIIAADPVLIDVVPAGEAMPELGGRMILHAGPPISWDRMCGPMRGAVTGICVFEGWAKISKPRAIWLPPVRLSFIPIIISLQSVR